MSTIRIVNELGQVETPEPEKPLVGEYNVSAPVFPQLELQAMADVMGIEGSDIKRYGDNLETLLAWVKRQTSDHSLENLKYMIRTLEQKLGTPPLSEKRVSYMARYAYLDEQERSIREEKRQLEAN